MELDWAPELSDPDDVVVPLLNVLPKLMPNWRKIMRVRHHFLSGVARMRPIDLINKHWREYPTITDETVCELILSVNTTDIQHFAKSDPKPGNTPLVNQRIAQSKVFMKHLDSYVDNLDRMQEASGH
jgi:hypothetical protein